MGGSRQPGDVKRGSGTWVGGWTARVGGQQWVVRWAEAAGGQWAPHRLEGGGWVGDGLENDRRMDGFGWDAGWLKNVGRISAFLGVSQAKTPLI